MQSRHLEQCELFLPAVDIEDFNQNRQFAPEYSQKAYVSMLNSEYIIGNYLDSTESKLDITAKQRRLMVLIMEKLNEMQNYKLETLFLAVSIADRYLLSLASK